MLKSVQLNQKQINKLENLFFVYGNDGPKHSNSAHLFIRGLIERNIDFRKMYNPSEEVLFVVDEVLECKD